MARFHHYDDGVSIIRSTFPPRPLRMKLFMTQVMIGTEIKKCDDEMLWGNDCL